jgi:hypothetical protein
MLVLVCMDFQACSEELVWAHFIQKNHDEIYVPFLLFRSHELQLTYPALQLELLLWLQILLFSQIYHSDVFDHFDRFLSEQMCWTVAYSVPLLHPSMEGGSILTYTISY